jgi:hypothetical protein
MESNPAEEYRWKEPETNYFADIPVGDAYDELETMNDEEAIELGFLGGMEDLWDYVNQQYTITENEK